MNKAVKAILDDPYFHDKFTDADRALLRRLFNLGLDKPH